MGICGSKVEEEETVEQVVLTIDDGKRAEAVQANRFSDSLKGPTATAAQVGRPAPPLPQKTYMQKPVRYTCPGPSPCHAQPQSQYPPPMRSWSEYLP